MALTAELSTLEALYQTLKSNVTNAYEIRSSTDRDLTNAVWDTPNAESFRAAWELFRPQLQKFEETLAAAASDVATNHNNNAAVNGVTDAPNLAPVSAL
ncbi:hypothetical protein [uncultured Cellulomonas sp.]|uniref:hypothetical protein n=1 Tax=uncultured Cellulomonas sp. TaxID=189682 RepID=UPI0028E65DB9|nr:hypothetical protein [uncultured Cellulomonas sp.]